MIKLFERNTPKRGHRGHDILGGRNNEHRTYDVNGKAFQLFSATVLISKPEPVFSQASVDLYVPWSGIDTISSVPWPGPNVGVDASGMFTGVKGLGFHGLVDSALPGQKVLVGFEEGRIDRPYIVSKTTEIADDGPNYLALFDFPMTGWGHGPFDVGIGSFTGSFIMLRGTAPLPGDIDIVSTSQIRLIAAAGIVMSTPATLASTTTGPATYNYLSTLDYTVTGAFSFTCASNIDFISAGDIGFTAGAGFGFLATGDFDITAANFKFTGTAFDVTAATASLSGTLEVGGGGRSVAANGDLTTTMLGPMPIAATGVAIQVP